MKITTRKELYYYHTGSGDNPFIEWLESIKDEIHRNRVKIRLDRVRLGNLGDHKAIDSGVSEFRLDFGPGYRIYYGEEGNKVILLLCGGDKSSQKKDIKRAIMYWKDYLAR
jgi:putative addiction module killer protein